MPAAQWTTDEQRAFLETHLPTFLVHQAAHTLTGFSFDVQRAWYAKYPEEARLNLPLPSATRRELTAEEQKLLAQAKVKRNGQIASWFRRAALKKRGGRGLVARAGAPGIDAGTSRRTAVSAVTQALVKRIQQTPGRRLHKESEIFQILFADRIKTAMLDAGWTNLNEAAHVDNLDQDATPEMLEEQKARIDAARRKRFQLYQQTSQELWKNASVADRAKVEEARRKEAMEMAERKERLEEAGISDTPTAYQDGVDSVEEICLQSHEAIENLAGWVGFTVTGGPVPELSGRLSVKIICFGHTDNGNTFRTAYSQFQDAIEGPFNAFLQQVFPETERERRAMPVPTEEPTADADSETDTVTIPKPRRIRRKPQQKLPTLPDVVVPTPTQPATTSSPPLQTPERASEPTFHHPEATPPALPFTFPTLHDPSDDIHSGGRPGDATSWMNSEQVKGPDYIQPSLDLESDVYDIDDVIQRMWSNSAEINSLFSSVFPPSADDAMFRPDSAQSALSLSLDTSTSGPHMPAPPPAVLALPLPPALPPRPRCIPSRPLLPLPPTPPTPVPSLPSLAAVAPPALADAIPSSIADDVVVPSPHPGEAGSVNSMLPPLLIDTTNQTTAPSAAGTHDTEGRGKRTRNASQRVQYIEKYGAQDVERRKKRKNTENGDVPLAKKVKM
ncbi:hypothetical protein C8F01DRAFT_1301470 [Mycena amicta]|nr:hypothetical protein C8F01DRAFT_1301470 [Mycena amicta]